MFPCLNDKHFAAKMYYKGQHALKGFNAISICYVEGHDVMKGFFERFGFQVIDQDEFDETIMELHY